MGVGGCLSAVSTLSVSSNEAETLVPAGQMHLTPPLLSAETAEFFITLAESGTVLDLWMCTRLLGNKASWYRAWLTERGGSVDSHPRSKTQYSLNVKKDNKTLDTRYTSCFQCSQNNPTGSTKWIHQLFDWSKVSWENKGEWPLGPVSSDVWI